jgi:hypothetical protein
VLPADVGLVRVGVEAAGHYHQRMIAAGVWPQGWQVLELNPAHVTAQRRVNGSRGGKTDRIDLTAIADLLLAGRGAPVIVGDAPLLELQAWVAHRRRRGEVRTATKNQLLGQLDRAFPGLGGTLADVLGSKVGRLVAIHFRDPARLARLGAERLRDYAARRDVRSGGSRPRYSCGPARPAAVPRCRPAADGHRSRPLRLLGSGRDNGRHPLGGTARAGDGAGPADRRAVAGGAIGPRGWATRRALRAA